MVYGGTDVKRDMSAMNRAMPDILVATPGRCLDIMTQSIVGMGTSRPVWTS